MCKGFCKDIRIVYADVNMKRILTVTLVVSLHGDGHNVSLARSCYGSQLSYAHASLTCKSF